MAKKLLVSSRKVVKPAPSSKEASRRPNSDSSSGGSSSSSSDESDQENEPSTNVVQHQFIPSPTGSRGKQLRLPKADNKSGSESDDSLVSIHSEDDDEVVKEKDEKKEKTIEISSNEKQLNESSKKDNSVLSNRIGKRSISTDYVLSQYACDQLVLFTSEKKIEWNKSTSDTFRSDIESGKIKRIQKEKIEEVKPSTVNKSSKKKEPEAHSQLEKDKDKKDLDSKEKNKKDLKSAAKEENEKTLGKDEINGEIKPKDNLEIKRKEPDSISLVDKKRKIEVAEPSQPKKLKGDVPKSGSVNPISNTVNYGVLDPAMKKQLSEKLMKEARNLKHEGDKLDKKENLKRGKCYLKSAVKFFEYALVLAKLKGYYRAKGDATKAKHYGDSSIRILPQTGSLIEVTARTFNAVSRMDLVATSYKFAAIVYMYLFRSQRTKLEAIYRELSEAHKSAKVLGSVGSSSKVNPVSPNPSGTNSVGNSPVPTTTSPLTSGSQDKIVNHSATSSRSYDYFMKETSYLFKAFDMWSRFERYDRTALPGVTDFATVDADDVVKELKSIFE